MAERILSISGLRGVIGDGLTPDYLTRFAAAVGTIADGGTVVVSRDGRSTGEMVKLAVLAGLTATGCRVLDLGVASTPTCGVVVHDLGAAAGLQITASHNPIEWNGLKPFSNTGAVLNHDEGARLLKILADEAFAYRSWDRLGSVQDATSSGQLHLDKVLSLVNGDAIRKRRLKVVLDCNHGSGGVLTPRLLETLGCEVEVLGGTPDGQFEHTPEPLKENLTGLADAVRRHGADVGFAQDPDADRLAIVDEHGTYIGEELTLALCVDFILPHRPGPVVVNGSTSRTTADLAEKYGCRFYRSHVGEANVVTKMREVEAVIGGEGNGGLIEPAVGWIRDSFAAMAYVLSGLTERRQTVSQWVAELPAYTIVKSKIACSREKVSLACEALRRAFHDAEATEGDGLRLDWPNRWVQVRASNTEPIIRVIAEAPDSDRAMQLCEQAMSVVGEAVQA